MEAYYYGDSPDGGSENGGIFSWKNRHGIAQLWAMWPESPGLIIKEVISRFAVSALHIDLPLV
jgi:hypothetical protein